jgi:hypothetical protein
LSTTRTGSLLDSGNSLAAALTGGYHLAWSIGAFLVLGALLLAMSLPRPQTRSRTQTERMPGVQA